MNDSTKLDFHFIDLKGAITGDDLQPASVTSHRWLSLNKTSLNKLLATHGSENTGEPLAATTAPSVEQAPAPEERPMHISSLVLGVDFSLPSSAATLEAVVPELSSEAEDHIQASDPDQDLPVDQPSAVDEVEAPAPDATLQVEEDVQASNTDQDLHFDLPAVLEAVDVSEPDAETLAEQDASIGDPDQDLHADLPLPVETVEVAEPEAMPLEEEAIHADPAPANPNEALQNLVADLDTEQEEDVRTMLATSQMPLEVTDLLKLQANVPPTGQDEQHAPDLEPPSENESAVPALPATALGDSDSVLSDVQSTLDSLADMAKDLTQRKLEAIKQQDGLDQRKAQLYEKERLLADKEEQLRLLETRLTREVSNLERSAEDNARALAERSAALKALAENVEARDRSTTKFAETLRQEKQRNDELAEALQRRGETLDEREAALNRKEDDLAEKLKQLISTKERFRKIVKAFNETVQFNDTLNAISSTALDDNPH